MPITTIEEFTKGAETYIQEFDQFIQTHNLQEHSKVDHLCYKCESAKEFERMRRMFEQHSDFIYQSIISNRRIDIIRLQPAIVTAAGPIYFIELSDQKPDGSQQSSFDHSEIYPTSTSYDALVQLLREKGVDIVEVKRPHHTTHDISLTSGFGVKISHEPLIEKIKREEIKL